MNDIGHLKKESLGLVRLRESKGLLNYKSKVMKRRQRTPKKIIILGIKTSLSNNLKSAFTIFFKLRQTLDKHLRISTLRIISKVEIE